MTKDTFYKGDDIKLPYQLKNEDGSLINLSDVTISIELRYHGKMITSFRGKSVEMFVELIDNNNFNVFIPRRTTEILPISTDYDLLIKLDDESPYKTTWDKHSFKLL